MKHLSQSVTHTGNAATFAYTPPMKVYGGERVLLALAHPEDIRHIVPAQAWTLLSFVLMSVGLAAGFVIATLT